MKPKKKPTRTLRRTDDETSFREVVGLIEQAREHALRTVNTVLIDLYWQVGEYISRKLESAAWGEGESGTGGAGRWSGCRIVSSSCSLMETFAVFEGPIRRFP